MHQKRKVEDFLPIIILTVMFVLRLTAADTVPLTGTGDWLNEAWVYGFLFIYEISALVFGIESAIGTILIKPVKYLISKMKKP